MSIWERLFLRKTKAEVAPGWLALAFGIGFLSVKYVKWQSGLAEEKELSEVEEGYRGTI